MCGKELRNKNESVSYDEFIKRSISVHGNTYLYDKTKEEYKNASTKVTITCKKHGDFKQLPSNHMNGIGCKKCADEINGRLRIKTTEDGYVAHNANCGHTGCEYLKDAINHLGTDPKLICAIEIRE